MRAWVVVAVTLTSTHVAHARPDCEGEARELRGFLTAELGRADTWNALWALGFGAAAIGQTVVAQAEFKPGGEFDAAYREQLYVGTVKASIGVVSKLVTPLRITVPARTADDCADVRALQKAIAHAAEKERKSIWLTLIGGTAVNLTGAIWLWIRHDFKTGATSFLTGVPTGPLAVWTQPKGAMRLYKKKRVDWVAGIGWIGGTF